MMFGHARARDGLLPQGITCPACHADLAGQPSFTCPHCGVAVLEMLEPPAAPDPAICCHVCGYDLTGLRCFVCPECGADALKPLQRAVPDRRSERNQPAWGLWQVISWCQAMVGAIIVFHPGWLVWRLVTGRCRLGPAPTPVVLTGAGMLTLLTFGIGAVLVAQACGRTKRATAMFQAAIAMLALLHSGLVSEGTPGGAVWHALNDSYRVTDLHEEGWYIVAWVVALTAVLLRSLVIDDPGPQLVRMPEARTAPGTER